jgi:putative endonuclease
MLAKNPASVVAWLAAGAGRSPGRRLRDDSSTLAFELARAAQRKSLRRRRHAPRAAATPHDDPPRLSPAQRRGADYEERALQLLLRAGLRLLARNLRCPMGEIDLVMRDGPSLVMVEVRARTSRRFGGAAASVGTAKQARLLRTAAYLLPGLARRHWAGNEPAVRFDVVAFDDDEPTWLPHAFALP